MEIAIGFKNCACLLFSNSKGAKPAIVVNEVKKIALKRDLPASESASSNFIPSFRLLLNFPMSTNPSLTIIPINAMIPKRDKILTGKSNNQCPQATAVKLKGINKISNNGCE